MAVCSYDTRLSLVNYGGGSREKEKGLGWYLWIHFSAPSSARKAVRAAIDVLRSKLNTRDIMSLLAKEAVAPGSGSGIPLPETCMEARILYPPDTAGYDSHGGIPGIAACDWVFYYKNLSTLVTAMTAIGHLREWAGDAKDWLDSGLGYGFLPNTRGVHVGFMLPLCFPPMVSPVDVTPVAVCSDGKGDGLGFDFVRKSGWARECHLKHAAEHAEERRRERCQPA